jgi:hypothetical protein
MDSHLFFDIISLVGLFAASWVGLAIKNVLEKMRSAQADVKAELVQKQTDIARDLTAKHAENRMDLATHSARDEEQFKGIGQRFDFQNITLARIENKIDTAVRNGKGS